MKRLIRTFATCLWHLHRSFTFQYEKINTDQWSQRDSRRYHSFTFQYEKINTRLAMSARIFYNYLHSNMKRLILTSTSINVITTFVFTFQYEKINTRLQAIDAIEAQIFTFQYEKINTSRNAVPDYA